MLYLVWYNGFSANSDLATDKEPTYKLDTNQLSIFYGGMDKSQK